MEAVISTGRRRDRAPAYTASATARPASMRWFMALTMTTPLSTATPNRAMKPMEPGTDRYWPEKNSAAIPPMSASGTLGMIKRAWPTELKAKYSNSKISPRDRGTTIIARGQ